MKTYTCTKCPAKVCVAATSSKDGKMPERCPFNECCEWVEVRKPGV